MQCDRCHERYEHYSVIHAFDEITKCAHKTMLKALGIWK